MRSSRARFRGETGLINAGFAGLSNCDFGHGSVWQEKGVSRPSPANPLILLAPRPGLGPGTYGLTDHFGTSRFARIHCATRCRGGIHRRSVNAERDLEHDDESLFELVWSEESGSRNGLSRVVAGRSSRGGALAFLRGHLEGLGLATADPRGNTLRAWSWDLLHHARSVAKWLASLRSGKHRCG